MLTSVHAQAEKRQNNCTLLMVQPQLVMTMHAQLFACMASGTNYVQLAVSPGAIHQLLIM